MAPRRRPTPDIDPDRPPPGSQAAHERPGGAGSAERAFREIALELATLRDPAAVVQRVVRAAGQLVEADGAILSRFDPEDGLLHWGVDDGVHERFDPEYVRTLTLEIGVGLTGRAVAERRVLVCNEGLLDAFPRSPASDRFFEVSGFRAMIAAPIAAGPTLFGALEVYARRESAFDERDAELLEAFAAQAAAALANARLIDDLDRSRQALRERAERERSLRETGARLTAVEDVDTVLQRIVQEAHRLMAADGARIDLLDEATLHLHWTYAAGDTAEADARLLREQGLPLGRGVAGKAAAEGRAILTGDVMNDPAIDRPPASIQFVEETGIRSVLSAPLPGGERPLGTLSVLSRRKDAFGQDDVDLLVTFALQASIAMTNARRMEALRRATDENARRADRERTLREIAGRIGRLREARGIVQLAVDAAARLLGADGARIDVVGSAGGALRRRLGEIVSDDAYRLGPRSAGDEEMGVSGEAMRRGRAFWTDDYVEDRTFPRTPAQDADIARLGMRSVIAAPIEGEEGALGALTVLSRRPAAFSLEDGATLEALASLVGVALQTAELLQRVGDSEARFRFRLGASPDMAWEADADGVTRFVSAASRTIFGLEPEEMVGRHFGEFVTPATADAAVAGWAGLVAEPGVVHSSQFSIRHADGTEVPLENFAVGLVDPSGRFIGAHGSVRDLRERRRLERALIESQERYRMLVEDSPDVVWQTDETGVFVYLSESIERHLGWRPEELVGRPFTEVVDQASLPEALGRVAAIAADPSRSEEITVKLIHKDGRHVPFDIRGRGLVRDGRFAGIHGASRDVSDRVRLEREAREQAGALAAAEERAHLARELHDSVTQALFSMGLLSRSIEVLIEQDPATAKAKLADLRDLQREALAEMRSLVFELRPGSLQQEGLTAALRTHVAGVEARLGLPVVLDLDEVGRLPLAVEDALYRIAQEALHNVVKHAGAQHVRIELAQQDKEVVLRVTDDGAGFDPGSVPDGHLGLAGMRSRAGRAGGRLDVRSVPGRGTTVEVRVPARPLDEPWVPPGDGGTGPVGQAWTIADPGAPR